LRRIRAKRIDSPLPFPIGSLEPKHKERTILENNVLKFKSETPSLFQRSGVSLVKRGESRL
jgi:hypothetical protein